MKRLLLPALLLLALSARATVYQPGLWFVHDDTTEQISTSKYPSIAAMDGAVPCQGVFMEYTTTVSTNVEPWTTSFGQPGTNAYSGTVFAWHVNEGFGYEGTFFVEKGKTYTVAKWHGRYMRVKMDGNVLFSDTGWFNTPNGTYTASETGWIPFEVRAGINGEKGIGPLNRSFGTGFNTEGLPLVNRNDTNWALPPWRKFLDPGDCSLLRIVKSETDYMTLDSVAMNGTDLDVTASFADVPGAGVLTAFYGASDGGDLPSAWNASAVLGTVAAGSAASVAYTVPGAAGANFVALRLQRTDYATGPYTQFTTTAAVPKPVPTFDLSCDDVGYTNMTFTAVVASVGIGATSLSSAAVEIATDDAFANIVKTIPLSLTAAGSETAYTSGLVTNTVYYARVAGTNNAGASNVSATVGPLQTLLPTISTSTIEALEHGLGALNAAVTVTDWGLDSTGARVRLEAAESLGFHPLVGVSEEVDATLGVATNLMVFGLREDYVYDLRARIVNSWGFVEYRTLADQRTRGRPFVGTPIVWETDPAGRLAVHERLVDNEFAGEAELFLGGVSQGVRSFPVGPCRLSWTGLAQPAWPVEARVVVRVVVSSRPYSEEWRATVVPGSASYREAKWVYDPSAKTLSWTDSYPTLNVVSNVTAKGKELTIGSNKNNSLALNCDFSPGVEDGWSIVAIGGEGAFASSSSFITNLVCPSTMRRIGRASFENNKTLRAAIFNEGLESLGTDSSANNCFNGCLALETIGPIPSTVTNIGPAVFKGCSSLACDISWPGSLRVVPNNAFYGSSIRSFRAEYGVTHVGAYGNDWSYPFGKCNAVKDIDLPVTLQYVSSRLFGDTALSSGFTANVWYRGFPKLGWHRQLWDNTTYGKTTVTNWFEWHHRDEFRAFAETNQTFEIRLPETYRGEGTWKASGCSQIVRWWKDPDQMPPSVMILR